MDAERNFVGISFYNSGVCPVSEGEFVEISEPAPRLVSGLLRNQVGKINFFLFFLEFSQEFSYPNFQFDLAKLGSPGNRIFFNGKKIFDPSPVLARPEFFITKGTNESAKNSNN